jgi:fructose-1,6-bisphosphatase/sedoheptulose 1,7-bisphosphatase-like protein
MAGEGVLVAATSVTWGRFLRAVDVKPYGICTHSLVLCSRCKRIRKTQTIHRRAGAEYPVQLGSL